MVFQPYLNQNGELIHKYATGIDITPSGVIGALTGAFVAGKSLEAQEKKRLGITNIPNTVANSPSYLKDFNSLNQNLRVIFTPFNVIFVIKDGIKELTVDNISVTEMDPMTRERFNAKDALFFKNIILGKVRSDIDLAERAFAKRIIERQLALGMSGLDQVKMACENPAYSELVNHLTEGDAISVPFELGQEVSISKLASLFGGGLNFAGVQSNNLSELQGKFDNSKYLGKKLQVGFLPDRVIFIVDGVVISQMSVLDMNEEGFEAFSQNDMEYFEDFFRGALKTNRAQEPYQLIKRASEIANISDIFNEPLVHPAFLYEVVSKRLGLEWLEYDPEVAIVEIERAFGLADSIHEIVLNKLLAIVAINSEKKIPFKNPMAFEKIVRSLIGRPIDFESDEPNISLGEFVFAIDCMEALTPYEDIVDDISPGVIESIADALTGQDYTVAFPDKRRSLDIEFWDVVSDLILERIAGAKHSQEINADAAISSAQKELDFFKTNVRSAVSHFRVNGLDDTSEIGAFVFNLCSSYRAISLQTGIATEETLSKFETSIVLAVEDNLAVDIYLESMAIQHENLILKFQSEV